MANKICDRCEKSLPKKDFESHRRVCRACALSLTNIAKSSSPYKYLKN